MSRPTVIACMFSSSDSWELQQHPRLWHSRAGGGAVHSIRSGHATTTLLDLIRIIFGLTGLAVSPALGRDGIVTALLRRPVHDVRQEFRASHRTRAPQAPLALRRAKAMHLAWSAHRKILAAIAPP